MSPRNKWLFSLTCFFVFFALLLQQQILKTSNSVVIAGSRTNESSAGEIFLPLVHHPIPTPTFPSSTVETEILITPNGGLNASTYLSNSFIITQRPGSNHSISEIKFDLSTALLPDVVFDPFGTAGDLVAKDVHVNFDSGTDYIGRSYFAEHDGGYDGLQLSFSNFSPGDTFQFSIDIDPTSVKGGESPGPNHSGSVSGLELSGSSVTIKYSNGLVLTGHIFNIPNSQSGGKLLLREGIPPRPSLLIDATTETLITTNDPNHLLTISGTPTHSVRVLVVEGGMFVDGLPNGGFDIDPFEANSVVVIQEYSSRYADNGITTIPIIINNSHPQAGYNIIMAIEENNYGHWSSTSAPIILKYNP